MTVVIALIGAKSLYILYGWLLSGVVASWLSDRKGYGERPGLASGLLLAPLGVILWIFWPAKLDSRWKVQGPLPWGHRGESAAAARLHD